MAENKLKFSVAIKSELYQNLILDTLKDKKLVNKFIADISTVVSNNPMIADCTPGSILSAGLMAQSLNLSLSPSLGHCGLVPFKDNKTGEKKAQFQIMKNGFVQLALRTAQYEKLGTRQVHKGELLGQDEFGEDIFKFSHECDNNEVIGYMAYLKLNNGFTKKIYWTKEQCDKHGRRYSKSYGTGKSTDLWKNEFDIMAEKTVLKQLITKWGIMSTELQMAIQSDQAIINQDGTLDYIDRKELLPVEEKQTTITNSILPDEETGEVVEEVEQETLL